MNIPHNYSVCKLHSLLWLLVLLFGYSAQAQDNPGQVIHSDTSEVGFSYDSSGNKFRDIRINTDFLFSFASRSHWSYILPESLTAQARAALPFALNRPTVVVLIHGVTGYPARNPNIGRMQGARFEWGYDFITALLGDVNQRPHTFADDSELTGVIGRDEWETKHIDPFNVNHHFITLYGKPNPARNHYPFSLMLTYRDGSISMKKQVANTAGMIVSLYQRAFGDWPAEKQPQLILLCHSFGGLVARTICSNPTSIPSRNPDIPEEFFTEGERRNMDFIRNRTVHITTIATPHEGSPVTLNAQLGSVLQHLVPDIKATDPDTDIIQQLSQDFIRDLNRSILQPDRCRRSNNLLIPVHAIGGRVPAGPTFFANPNQHDNDLGTVDGGIGRTNIDNLLEDGSNRSAFEAYGLLRVDYAMHLFFGPFFPMLRPWGVTPTDNPQLDIIQIRDVGFPVPCLHGPIYSTTNFLAKPRLYYLRNRWTENRNFLFMCNGTFASNVNTVQDGEIDSDGFVPISSALGVKLGTDITNVSANFSGGSWYRFYRSGADFQNHGSIKQRAEVGRWLRLNIIGNEPSTLLFGRLHNINAAGPNISRVGIRSVW
jgi:hypothetical protein